MDKLSAEYTMKRINNSMAAATPILLGIMLLIVGLRGLINTNSKSEQLVRCTVETTASVDDVEVKKEWRSNDDGGGHYETIYIIHYDFEIKGKTYKDTYQLSSEMKKGETIEVLYNSDDPNEHCTKMEKNALPHMKKASTIFTIAGGALIGIGIIIILVRTLRKGR